MSDSKAPLEKRRNQLIDSMYEASKQIKHTLTLVFDGHLSGTLELRRHHKGPLEIIYTAPFTTDDFLVDEFFNGKNAKEKTIVSSDKHLCRRCKEFGAHAMSVEDFLPFLEKKSQLASPEESYRDSPYEIRRLQKLFEDRLRDN